MIEIHEDAASLIADPHTIEEALALLSALERLELIVTVNGVTSRFPIQFSDGNAVIVANITV